MHEQSTVETETKQVRDIEYTVESRSTAYAKALFDRAKMRLLSVHEWPGYISSKTNGYVVTDNSEAPQHRIISNGDHIRAHKSDSVQPDSDIIVSDVGYQMPNRNAELLSVTLKSASVEGNSEEHDGYLFILKREGSVVSIQYHEEPGNGSEHGIGLAGILGFAPDQWDMLIRSIITFE